MDPTHTAIVFHNSPEMIERGGSVEQFGVYDEITGALIGVTIKLGGEPIMMLPVVPIPPGAIRFDPEQP